MRHPKLRLTTLLFITTVALAAQPSDYAKREDQAYLPAGPFLFEPGTIHPTYMDAFDTRPVVKSPDGKLGLTVSGPKESYAAWVTISPSTFPDGPVQVWPVQANVDVLWRPDSQEFALTDNRYANLSYLLVCGTEFRMGEDELGLGVAITDLTPVVRKAFEERAGKYYETDDYETRLFYAKALRWIGSPELLVGVSARTVGPVRFPNKGQREWDFAYVMNVADEKIVREVDKDQLLSEYKIKVP